MADQNPTAPGADSELQATERQELQDEALILRCLLVHWPIHLQSTDLLRKCISTERTSAPAIG